MWIRRGQGPPTTRGASRMAAEAAAGWTARPGTAGRRPREARHSETRESEGRAQGAGYTPTITGRP